MAENKSSKDEQIGFHKGALTTLAKEREEIFLPHKKNPIRLPKASPALRLIQRIRNEAHRFAISHYRKLHRKRLLT